MKKRDVGRFLPRSKLGAAIAVAYLILVFFLLFVTAFGGGGLHGSAAMAALFAVGLTLPLSWFAIRVIDSMNPAPGNPDLDYFFFPLLAVCAVINAGVIYLFVGFAARALRALGKIRSHETRS